MRAIGKNVIVERMEQQQTGSVIIYTDNSKVTLARVIAIGEDVKSVAVDDEIVINWNAAVPVKLDQQYYIVSIDNVYAVK